MEKSFLVLFGVAFIVLFLLVVPWLKTRICRKRLLSAPISEEWLRILREQVPIYRRVPPELRRQLHGLVNIFLAEKNFEGCGGLKMTDEIRVCVAAQACVLLLNRNTNFYPTLSTVLVYPGAYFVKGRTRLADQIVEDEMERLGESWTFGEVILSWDHVKHGPLNLNDGHNVVLHEFAHQLDQEGGHADGIPPLGSRTSYIQWARILKDEYQSLRVDVSRGIRDVIDAYGATDPAEFFAVATETFFELPAKMKSQHPDLYDEFRGYYRLDPASWTEISD